MDTATEHGKRTEKAPYFLYKQVCNPTANLFHLIMLASHIDHRVSCSGML